MAHGYFVSEATLLPEVISEEGMSQEAGGRPMVFCASISCFKDISRILEGFLGFSVVIES